MPMPRAQLEASWRDERRRGRERILEATRALLEDRPWQQLSLQEIMAAAELSRTMFYRHFEDREALLLALLGDLAEAFVSAGAEWKNGSDDPLPALRSGLHEVSILFARHGRVLQALVDASSQSAQLREVYAEMVATLVRSTRTAIAAEIAAGRSDVDDPDGVARALLWMNERFLLDVFGRSADGDPARAAAVLTDIWIRTLYQSSAASQATGATSGRRSADGRAG